MINNQILLFIPLIIAGLSLWMSYANNRQAAKADYVDQLESRIGDLEKRMKDCEDARKDLGIKNLELSNQNLDLLTRIVGSVVSDKISVSP